MSKKGQSYKSEPWAVFEKGDYSFLHDDFVHEKTFVLKAKLQHNHAGINIKESYADKGQGLIGSVQSKFWFALRNKSSIYTKITPTGQITMHYDHGVDNYSGLKFNPYASIKSNRSFDDKAVKAGVGLTGQDWAANLRIKYEFPKKTWILYEKFNFLIQGWNFNSYGVLDLTNRNFTKAGILLKRDKQAENKNNYFVRLESAQYNAAPSLATLFENLIFNATRNVSKTTTLAIEAKTSIKKLKELHKNGLDSLWLGGQWKLDEEGTTVKVRVDSNLSHAISIKNRLGSYGSYTLGVEMSEVGSKNKFKYGVQVDLEL